MSNQFTDLHPDVPRINYEFFKTSLKRQFEGRNRPETPKSGSAHGEAELCLFRRSGAGMIGLGMIRRNFCFITFGLRG